MICGIFLYTKSARIIWKKQFFANSRFFWIFYIYMVQFVYHFALFLLLWSDSSLSWWHSLQHSFHLSLQVKISQRVIIISHSRIWIPWAMGLAGDLIHENEPYSLFYKTCQRSSFLWYQLLLGYRWWLLDTSIYFLREIQKRQVEERLLSNGIL